MTTLTQQIEEMRLRIRQIAEDERTSVASLGDALSLADQKLLQDVRLVAAEHEVRRGVILKELEHLASRIGAFPPQRELCAALEGAMRTLEPADGPRSGVRRPMVSGRSAIAG
jgi:hypothetical protein